MSRLILLGTHHLASYANIEDFRYGKMLPSCCRCCRNAPNARLAELVYALDLGSSGATLKSSSLLPSTILVGFKPFTFFLKIISAFLGLDRIKTFDLKMLHARHLGCVRPVSLLGIYIVFK
jgi:hypothetical protein